jgi:hypothetical protein
VSGTDPDRSAVNHLWLVVHERDDPMTLSQSEHPREDAAATMKRLIKERLEAGAHVDPPIDKCEIGRRYDVHDANGWLATYWLSEEQLPADEGMLTAIVGPASRQRAHRIETRRG